jgi:hypothetical protein
VTTLEIRVRTQRAERCPVRYARFTAFILLLLAASTAHAQSTVTVSWDRNTDSYTAGYRLYYGTASGSYQWSLDAGNQTSAPVNLSPGSAYFMTVRAYNSRYEYSPPSSEATINLTTPTNAPTARLQAVLQSANSALVSWQTSNASAVSINGVAVAASGSQTVTVTTTTTFTVTATGAGGATARASATVSPTAAQGPPAPNSMTAVVSASRATLNWKPGAGGTPATEYLVYVSTAAGGQNVINGNSVGDVLTVSGSLPNGRYFARVRARNAAGTSTSSNEVSFIVGRTLAAPTDFTVTWSGTTATLRWKATAADSLEDAATGYILEAGSNPGLSDIGAANVGNVTSYSADVSAGVYYARVRAVNANGSSQVTADIPLVAPGAPGAPAALAETSAAGEGTVRLRWTAPDGTAPIGYIVEAGSEPGLSDLARLQVASGTEFSTEAAAGAYFVRVRAVNERGAGPSSNEILVKR